VCRPWIVCRSSARYRLHLAGFHEPTTTRKIVLALLISSDVGRAQTKTLEYVRIEKKMKGREKERKEKVALGSGELGSGGAVARHDGQCSDSRGAARRSLAAVINQTGVRGEARHGRAGAGHRISCPFSLLLTMDSHGWAHGGPGPAGLPLRPAPAPAPARSRPRRPCPAARGRAPLETARGDDGRVRQAGSL
jgi:hypothetical protein